MGLDAPSSDLTERIQAKRKALVRDGSVTPALPGEHLQHGRGGPGSSAADIARLDMLANAASRRAGRAFGIAGSHEGDTRVVEMDYTDYSAGESEPEAPDFLAEELDDILPADEPVSPEEEEQVWTPKQATDYDVLNARISGVNEQLEGVAAALILIAEKVGDLHTSADKEAALHDAILGQMEKVVELYEEMQDCYERERRALEQMRGQVGIFWRAWRYLFAR